MYLQSDGHESGKYCERARLSSIERATTMTRKKERISFRSAFRYQYDYVKNNATIHCAMIKKEPKPARTANKTSHAGEFYSNST